MIKERRVRVVTPTGARWWTCPPWTGSSIVTKRDDLENDDESPESQESCPKWFKLVKGEKAMERSQGGEGVEPKATACGAKEAQGEQDQDTPDHLQVDLSLQFAPPVSLASVV